MLVAINGVRVAPEQATVSLFDRGFLFGDAVYDVIRTREGRLFELEAHLERLERSGAAIGLDVASLRPELEQTITELVAAAPAEGELYVRIMITAGATHDLDLSAADGPPVRIVIVKPLSGWPERMRTEGVRLRSVRPEEVVGRVAPWVKSTDRLANVMAHRHALAGGDDDALFVDPAGNVTEGPTWNVFLVKDGEVVTPALAGGILPGITRGLILRLCGELGIGATERDIPLEEALGADELFITSTTRGVMAVASLDGTALTSAPGPVTVQLRDALARLEEAGG